MAYNMPVIYAEFACVWTGDRWLCFRRTGNKDIITYEIKWTDFRCLTDSSNHLTGQSAATQLEMTIITNGTRDSHKYSPLESFTAADGTSYSWSLKTEAEWVKIETSVLNSRCENYLDYRLNSESFPPSTPLNKATYEGTVGDLNPEITCTPYSPSVGKWATDLWMHISDSHRLVSMYTWTVYGTIFCNNNTAKSLGGFGGVSFQLFSAQYVGDIVWHIEYIDKSDETHPFDDYRYNIRFNVMSSVYDTTYNVMEALGSTTWSGPLEFVFTMGVLPGEGSVVAPDGKSVYFSPDSDDLPTYHKYNGNVVWANDISFYVTPIGGSANLGTSQKTIARNPSNIGQYPTVQVHLKYPNAQLNGVETFNVTVVRDPPPPYSSNANGEFVVGMTVETL
jgi:hypothetical protein